MLGIIAMVAVAVAAAGLGIKGFAAEGIPFSHTSSIKGTAGKIVGILCFLISLAAIVVAILMFVAGQQPAR